MAKNNNPLITKSFERPKKRRPGVHKKNVNKRNKPKNFFG
jgi:hypothetical protein